MITPNIEALTLSELRYVASKKGLKNAEVMDREDLLEALIEIYEEQASNVSGEGVAFSPSTQPRFMNTLVELDSEQVVGPLPGVQPLPEVYAETRIHLLLKDPYWAHAYWSVCPTDLQKLEQTCSSYEFFLRACIQDEHVTSSEVGSFDIDVDKEDTSWNINLPERGRSYIVSLYYRDDKENIGLLCQSGAVCAPKSYYLEQSEKLVDNDNLFTLLFSALVSKGGVMIENPLLKEVVEQIDTRVGG